MTVRRSLSLLRSTALFGATLLAAASCASSGPTVVSYRTVELGEPFELKSGEAVRLRETGTLIGFGAVLEDSRCPIEAMVLCVWAGNARVRLWMAPAVPDPLADAAEFDLNTGIEPRVRDAGLLRVTLTGVTPAARLEPPAALAYRAQLVVTLRQ